MEKCRHSLSTLTSSNMDSSQVGLILLSGCVLFPKGKMLFQISMQCLQCVSLEKDNFQYNIAMRTLVIFYV